MRILLIGSLIFNLILIVYIAILFKKQENQELNNMFYDFVKKYKKDINIIEKEARKIHNKDKPKRKSKWKK